MVGKRINLAGNAGTVIKVEKGLCTIKLDNYKTVSLVLESVVKKMPDLTARNTFNHKPGDKDG